MGPGRRTRVATLVLAVLVGAAAFPAVRWALRIGIDPLIGVPGSFWEYAMGHFFKALFVGGLLTSILFF